MSYVGFIVGLQKNIKRLRFFFLNPYQSRCTTWVCGLAVVHSDYTLMNRIAFQPIFLGQGSPALVENYWDLVNEKGIQGCVSFNSY
jgi:hypothetical protein